MGLRIIARMYDRSEALVMSSCLEAAGVPHWVFGAEMININPLHEIAFDGYKLVTAEADLVTALNVLDEALANPAPSDERLEIRRFPISFAVFHLVQLALVLMFLWLPMRRYRWIANSS